jgi:riboflavin kinase/FMN adenylyltransferase
LAADGGYVTLAHINDTVYRSVTNIGVRPTFGPNERTVETYILDFGGDLYGRGFSIEFVKRLRGEIRFETLDKLKAQIESDVAIARTMPIE